MLSERTKFRTLPALLLALTTWACTDVGQPLGPEHVPSGPAASLLGSTFTIVEESTPNTGEVSAVIGEEGGKLILGEHELRVSAGAVGAPTTFRISKTDENHLRMKLTATQITENDIGSKGFAVPVELVLSYSNVLDVADPLLFKVIWIRPDGSHEAQSTSVDLLGAKVHASLQHFSDYAVAVPN